MDLILCDEIVRLVPNASVQCKALARTGRNAGAAKVAEAMVDQRALYAPAARLLTAEAQGTDRAGREAATTAAAVFPDLQCGS